MPVPSPAPAPTFQTLINELMRPSAAADAAPQTSSELFTFDIPLNGTGFDEFISQLTQTLNQIAPTAQEDVVVAPTEAQINEACVVIPSREADLSDQYVCPIDLSPIDDDENVMIIKHCKHAFRESNLRELFTRDVRCPMCRFDIRDHVEVFANEDEDALDSPLETFD
jgi:hypothetical protein